jgi:hypothetical protein
MRRTVLPALALLALGGLAACTTGPGSPSTTPTPTAAPAPPCPVGDWKSTGVTANANVVGTTITFDGGADVKTTIGSDGAVKADFTGMKPFNFNATLAGSPIGGEISYAGPLTGKVALSGSSGSTTSTATTTATTTAAAPTATAAPTGSAAAGGSPWTPVGPVSFADLKLTVKLTKPVPLTVVDGVKLGDVNSSQNAQAGNVIDLQPLLRNGTYRCNGNDTLVITPTSGSGPTVVWTFARATA